LDLNGKEEDMRHIIQKVGRFVAIIAVVGLAAGLMGCSQGSISVDEAKALQQQVRKVHDRLTALDARLTGMEGGPKESKLKTRASNWHR
jgi:hypothetical protein